MASAVFKEHRRKNRCESGANQKIEKRSSVSEDNRSSEASSEELAVGFDRGLQPKQVLGATKSNGQLMYLIKWKDSDFADLIPADQVNIRCPKIVIQFYEERLTFHESNDVGML